MFQTSMKAAQSSSRHEIGWGKIMKNHLICSMWYEFDVCVRATTWAWVVGRPKVWCTVPRTLFFFENSQRRTLTNEPTFTPPTECAAGAEHTFTACSFEVRT